MRANLIYNPTASTTNARVRDAVTTTLAEAFDLRVQPTRARGHATDLAAQAVEDGAEVVFSLGGDGTANEVVQALAGTNTVLAHVPGGGTNVLARSLGLPNRPVPACRRYIELARQPARAINLGRAAGRWFTFIAGLGFDAAIVRRVELRPRLKRTTRQLSFVWCGFAEWFADGAGLPPLVEVELPDGTHVGPATISIVGNTDPYTFLGPRPLRLTPRASFDTGIDLLTVDAVATPTILATLGRAFGRGSHVDLPHVGYWHDLPACTMRSEMPLPLMVDGDWTGDHTEVTFESAPSALHVLAEPSPTIRGTTPPQT